MSLFLPNMFQSMTAVTKIQPPNELLNYKARRSIFNTIFTPNEFKQNEIK